MAYFHGQLYERDPAFYPGPDSQHLWNDGDRFSFYAGFAGYCGRPLGQCRAGTGHLSPHRGGIIDLGQYGHQLFPGPGGAINWAVATSNGKSSGDMLLPSINYSDNLFKLNS